MTFTTQFTRPTRNIDYSNTPAYLPKSPLAIFLITVILITLILSGKYLFFSNPKVNDIADQNYYATTTFEYVDKNATQKQIKQTLDKIKPVLIKDEAKTNELLDDLDLITQKVYDIKEVIKTQPYINKSILSTTAQNYLYSLQNDDWQKNIYQPCKEILVQMLTSDLPEKYDKGYISRVVDEKLLDETDKHKKDAIKQIVVSSFFPDKEVLLKSRTTNSPLMTIKRKDMITLIHDYDKKLFIKLQKSGNSAGNGNGTSQINQVISSASFIFYNIETIRNKRRINALILNNLPDKINNIIPDIDENRLNKIDDATTNIFIEMLNKGLSEEDIKNIDSITDKYLTDEFTPLEKELIFLIIKQVAKPNMVNDINEMGKLRQEALKHIIPVYVKVYAGSTLVKKGEKITPEKLYVLNQSGQLNKEINWYAINEMFTLILLSAGVFILLTYFINKELLNSINVLWFISILTIITLLITYFLYNNYPKFIPLAVGTGLMAIFINRRIAFLHLLILSILIYQSFFLYWPNLISLIIGSICAACLPHRVVQRIMVIKYGVIIGLVQVIAYNFCTVSIDIFYNNQVTGFNYQIILESVYCFVSGLLASMIILTMQPIIEEYFGLVSFLKLNELGDFSQPLMQELEEKAPGTFQHSIAVATLSDYAARKLHLDSTCCRIGSYYHDIGKLYRPEYFVENQQDGVNPHDILDDPYKSAKIIISHARAGLVLAKKYKLPQALQAFIIEHHGTSLVAYFLYKAKQKLQEGEQIDKSFFRYFGPKPQSKETAIVMLADSCEAAVRAMKEKDRLTVREKIKDIVAEKMNDEQLTDSKLTTDEIAIIIESFTTVVLELHHQRIEYPSAKK